MALEDYKNDCLGQRRVSTRHRGGVTSDASLGVRVHEVGFTIVHKSASVLTVFQNSRFRSNSIVWRLPQSLQRATGRVIGSGLIFQYRERLDG